MASRTLELILQLQDNASKKLEGAFGNWEESSKKVGKAFTVVGGAITGAVGLSVKAFQQQERAEARLVQIARQVTNATDEEIASFKELASQLQSVGVVGDEVIIAGQSQIASFAKSADTVSILTSSLGDLAVAQYGSNVSQEQSIQTANLLGKALTGQLGALTRTGILVNDEFKAAFEAANTEVERAAVIAEIVADNYGGVNEAMRKTSEGGMQALKNSFGDLMETIGEAVIPVLTELVNSIQPVIDKIAAWREENPALFNTIVKVVAVLGALMLVLGPILIILPSIVAGVKLLMVAFALLVSPVGLVIAAIAALIAIGYLVIKNWEEISNAAVAIWGQITQFIGNIIDATYARMKSAGQSLQESFRAITSAIGGLFVGMWDGIKSGVTSGINWVIQKLNGFIRAANKVMNSLSVVPGVSLPNIPQIPMLAKGGIVTKPTLAMIGEAGPEAVIPLSKMNNTGGGTNIFFTFNGDVSGQEVIDKVSQGIMDKLRLNQRIAL